MLFLSLMSIEVTDLNCYPIKSCANTSLETAAFTARGIAFDREWMVADMAGTFMSQRKNPELSLVVPELTLGRLSIIAPGMEELSIDLADIDHEKVAATVHGNEAPAITQGDEANEWFSEYLKRPVQLVRADPVGKRQVKEVYRTATSSNEVAFADGASILLTTMPSLAALNERLEQPVPMNRFRPNIVVGGDDLSAFDEDYWRQLKIGDLSGAIGWGCTRCMITETDQATGEQGKTVLKALQGFRRGVDAVNPSNKGVFFGQNFLHVFESGVTVSVGDTVNIVEQAAERNILGLAD